MDRGGRDATDLDLHEARREAVIGATLRIIAPALAPDLDQTSPLDKRAVTTR